MDSVPVDTTDAEVVEVVSAPVDDAQMAAVDGSAPAEDTGQDRIASEVRYLADALNETSSNVDSMGVQMREGFGEVSDGIDALARGQRALSEQINETGGGETDGNFTVVIASGQWDEMRESWLWAKDYASLSLFVSVVCALLVAALFGSRLWSDFARGWRR